MVQPIKPYYGPLERVFRTCVFQLAVYTNGFIEKLLVYLYRACSKKTPCPTMVDERRIEESLKILKGLCGQEHFIPTRDRQATVHAMTFKANQLEEKINHLGGQWVCQGNRFVIIPPEVPSTEWNELERSFLKLGWNKKDNKIVTCDQADQVTPNQYCFLHVHSPGHPFAWDRQRVGFVLGMKQDFCGYDPRGLLQSKGTPSERGYYLDAEAVMDQVLTKYQADKIWVSGTCGGAATAAHLKRRHHDQGVNFISEQSFADMQDDVIAATPWIARKFALWNLDALKSRDITLADAPEEDYFSTRHKWEHLRKDEQGKVVLIHAAHDETLKPGAETRYLELARRVNTHVTQLEFSTPLGVNGHNVGCLEVPDLRRRLVDTIFLPIAQ
jgi:hypothetical protein